MTRTATSMDVILRRSTTLARVCGRLRPWKLKTAASSAMDSYHPELQAKLDELEHELEVRAAARSAADKADSRHPQEGDITEKG